jgi:hypothetical protein
MPRQKQVDEAISRCLSGKAPVGKVKCTREAGCLVLHHYHHLLLRWHIDRPLCDLCYFISPDPDPWRKFASVMILIHGYRREVLFQWHEKPTDKRILEAALEALRDDTPQVQGAVKRKAAGTVPAGEARGKRGTSGRFQTMVGEEVEEKSSRFLAIVAYPVADQAQAQVLPSG